MGTSLYNMSVATYLQTLNAVSGFLAKGADYCRDNGLDANEIVEVQLRRYTSFKRYQRNRFIETLHATGLSPAAIQVAVKGQLGEKLDKSHIRKLAKKGRMSE